MFTIVRGALRIEAGAVTESDGSCCVTAEVFHGHRMVRGYYRRVAVPRNRYADAERQVAEDVAGMCSQAE